jgi:hypothetical protein
VVEASATSTLPFHLPRLMKFEPEYLPVATRSALPRFEDSAVSAHFTQLTAETAQPVDTRLGYRCLLSSEKLRQPLRLPAAFKQRRLTCQIPFDLAPSLSEIGE